MRVRYELSLLPVGIVQVCITCLDRGELLADVWLKEISMVNAVSDKYKAALQAKAAQLQRGDRE